MSKRKKQDPDWRLKQAEERILARKKKQEREQQFLQEMDRILASAHSDPAERSEIIQVIMDGRSPQLEMAMSSLPPAYRAVLMRSWMDAVGQVVYKRRCRLCTGVAVRTYFYVIPRADLEAAALAGGHTLNFPEYSHGMMGCAAVCDHCDQMAPGDLQSKMLAHVVSTHKDGSPNVGPALICNRVGDVDGLPPGSHDLATCSECRRDVWVDPERRAKLAADDVPLLLICTICYGRLKAIGKVEFIPDWMLL